MGRGEMGTAGLQAGQRQLGTPQCSSSALRGAFRVGPGPHVVGGEDNMLGREGIKSGGVQMQLEGLWKDQLLESSACC